MTLFEYYYSILSRILELTGYQKDINQFANKFLIACHQLAFSDLLENLSEAQKHELQERVKLVKTIEEFPQVMKKYISEEAYAKAFGDYVVQELKESLQNVFPTLSEETKKSLIEYLTTLPFAKELEPIYITFL